MTNPPPLTASERAAARQALLDLAENIWVPSHRTGDPSDSMTRADVKRDVRRFTDKHYPAPAPRPVLTVRGATYTYHEESDLPWQLGNGRDGANLAPYAYGTGPQGWLTPTRAELVDAIAVIDATASWRIENPDAE